MFSSSKVSQERQNNAPFKKKEARISSFTSLEIRNKMKHLIQYTAKIVEKFSNHKK
jgi:hypothetical protein